MKKLLIVSLVLGIIPWLLIILARLCVVYNPSSRGSEGLIDLSIVLGLIPGFIGIILTVICILRRVKLRDYSKLLGVSMVISGINGISLIITIIVIEYL